MGSNGLTSARHDVFNKSIAARYPESFDNSIPDDLIYSGSRSLSEESTVQGITVGKLVLSPTRTYAPIIKKVLENHFHDIHGMIHCSGGAQTKVLNFVDEMKIIKNNMFPVPPLFQMIQKESDTPWQEMYKVFNMGHRMELYVPKEIAESIIKISEEFNVDARIVGYCQKADSKSLTINSEFGEFHY